MNLFLWFNSIKGHLLSNMKYQHIIFNLLQPSLFRPPSSRHFPINYDPIAFWIGALVGLCCTCSKSQSIPPHFILNQSNPNFLQMNLFLIPSLSILKIRPRIPGILLLSFSQYPCREKPNVDLKEDEQHQIFYLCCNQDVTCIWASICRILLFRANLIPLDWDEHYGDVT